MLVKCSDDARKSPSFSFSVEGDVGAKEGVKLVLFFVASEELLSGVLY
jgi:hypothetical protein